MRRELACEEKDIAVAQGMSDLLHAEVALQEKVARPLNPAGDEVLLRGAAKLAPEEPAEILGREAARPCQAA